MPTVSRRAILVAGAAVGPVVALAGCRDRAPTPPDPDAAVLAAARDTEQRLVASYDGPRRDVHLAHLSALGGSMPTASPPVAGISDPDGLVRSSVAALQAAAVQAQSGHVAATLASIAAAHLAQGTHR
jgi:hypothetical protein